MNVLKHPFPFSFDGHGVNDADGRRVLTVSVEKYTDGTKRNDQADILGRLGENSPNMVRALLAAEKHLTDLIAKDPKAGAGGLKSEHYAVWAFVNTVLEETNVMIPETEDEQGSGDPSRLQREGLV